MKPVYQTIMSAPYGNCMQAAIASILELPLNDVPNFVVSGDLWAEALDEFLAAYGLQSLRIDVCNGWVPAGWHLIDGPSKRGPFWHTLVAYQGNPVHDPYKYGHCELEEYKEWTLFVALLDGGDDDPEPTGVPTFLTRPETEGSRTG